MKSKSPFLHQELREVSGFVMDDDGAEHELHTVRRQDESAEHALADEAAWRGIRCAAVTTILND